MRQKCSRQNAGSRQPTGLSQFFLKAFVRNRFPHILAWNRFFLFRKSRAFSFFTVKFVFPIIKIDPGRKPNREEKKDEKARRNRSRAGDRWRSELGPCRGVSPRPRRGRCRHEVRRDLRVEQRGLRLGRFIGSVPGVDVEIDSAAGGFRPRGRPRKKGGESLGKGSG